MVTFCSDCKCEHSLSRTLHFSNAAVGQMMQEFMYRNCCMLQDITVRCSTSETYSVTVSFKMLSVLSFTVYGLNLVPVQTSTEVSYNARKLYKSFGHCSLSGPSLENENVKYLSVQNRHLKTGVEPTVEISCRPIRNKTADNIQHNCGVVNNSLSRCLESNKFYILTHLIKTCLLMEIDTNS